MKTRNLSTLGIAAVLMSAILMAPRIAGASSRDAAAAMSSDAIPAKGSAPMMKFKILNQSPQETTYAVIFGAGDEVFTGLTQFAQQNHIVAGRITGVGAVRSAMLGFFDPQRKAYRRISIDHQSEVLSMLGDIAMYQGKPVVHVHMVVGFPDGTAHGGHLLQAHVWPTLEVIVTSYPRPIYRIFDPEKGLAVIDPTIQK